MYMHGREEKEGKNHLRRIVIKRSGCRQHMRSVPSITTTRTTVEEINGNSPLVSTPNNTSDSFSKDGRKISVGDCALFKPPQDSPPFIGIIRWLTFRKENNLQLGVNWLYRPAEVKLGKGILLEAAPNELFYSFHKDEIPAASLLHPCKVAFLPKGIELPTGISSFVCRRVYDIENKCLWWLTDQDYINERQEEVDKLLDTTRIEMDAIVQPSGRSPKRSTNILMPTSQLKPASDNLPNSTSSIPSQIKGKKRERGDQSSDPVKRERSVKPDDCDSGLVKVDNFLRIEITKIMEKGGLLDSESVEKLVQLIQPDRMDKKTDLISRSMVAGVIAATDRFDCLNQFVQLKGLPVLDEWLQDVNKGRIGEGSSLKDGEKSVEDFLMVLLRALDKLPVNLYALQNCNIGRSVNHLRSHKNLEIQKKARSLVDTWKKQVAAEMNVIDSKSGSTQATAWPSKSQLPEVHGARNPGGSCDVALRSSVSQLSASKTGPIKASQGETTAKSASSSPGPIKSASSPASGKDSQPRTAPFGASDIPLSIKADKSSSSTQSHNYSQSFLGKEEARSLTAGSVSKISSGGSRHRKSINGFSGTLVSGSQKETGSSRNSSMQRNATQEKISQSPLMGEKTFDVPVVEVSSHKLIVKIPNRGRSPAQCASGGSFEDPSVMNSRASSPVISDRHASDRNLKEKFDAYRPNMTSDVNTESWHSNDLKDLQAGSDDVDRSPAALPDEEHSRNVEETRKAPEALEVPSSSSDLKSGNLHEASFSSMNALIESCVKYSEVDASISPGDDVGMNLLASVAAGEMCKSELVSPADSLHGSTPPAEDICVDDDGKSEPSPGDNLAQDCCQSNDADDADNKKQAVPAPVLASKDGMHLSNEASVDSSGDRKPPFAFSEGTVEVTVNCVSEMIEKPDEIVGRNAFSPTASDSKKRNGDQTKETCEEKETCNTVKGGGVPDAKAGENGSQLTEIKVSNVLSNADDGEQKVEVSSLNTSTRSDCKNDVNGRLSTGVHLEQNPAVIADGETSQPTVAGVASVLEGMDGVEAGEAHENSDNGYNQSEGQRLDKNTSQTSAAEEENVACLRSASTEHKSECKKVNSHNEVSGPHSSGSFRQNESSAVPSDDVNRDVGLKRSKLSVDEAKKMEESDSSVADATSLSAAGVSEMDSKMNFDLNEGLIGDDGKDGEALHLATSGCFPNVHVNTMNITVSSGSVSIPTSVTVAAAAKGPFVPPVYPLRNKGELGWKGSAATSAFRPAEPRKVLHLSVGPTNVSPDDSSSKSSRPLLDIDLNVPDERLLEDMACRDSTAEMDASDHLSNHDKLRNEFTGPAPGRSSGGLDLDLNRVDDANDMMHYPVSSSRRPEAPLIPIKSLSSSSLSTSEVRRDFDLNNGPTVDDLGGEQSPYNQQGRGSSLSVHSQLPVAGIRPNSLETGNFSAWFPPGNSYSSVTIPSALPDRGKHPFPIIAPGAPQRILGPSGGNPFTPDIFRGSVLSSSPAVPFPSNPFPYQMFPFGTTLPLPTGTFSVGSASYMDSTSGGRLFNPVVNSQFLGSVGAVSSQYPKPYMVSLPDGSINGGMESSRKWSRQGLDLNAGPGALDIESREDFMAQRQLLVPSSQALAEEQGRMYSVAGGVLKRKEPEGGLDSESFRYKQSSWQ